MLYFFLNVTQLTNEDQLLPELRKRYIMLQCIAAYHLPVVY